MAPALLHAMALAFVLAWPAPAFAQHEHHHPSAHAQLHADFYSRLQRPDVAADAQPWQKSCCNSRDCGPARARWREGGWQFLFKGEWRPVPESKILSEKSPDTQAHACVSETSGELLCFVKPDFGI